MRLHLIGHKLFLNSYQAHAGPETEWERLKEKAERRGVMKVERGIECFMGFILKLGPGWSLACKPAECGDLKKDHSNAQSCFLQNWPSTLASYWSLRKIHPCVKTNIVLPVLLIQTSSQTVSELHTLPVLQVFIHQNKCLSLVCLSELDWIILVSHPHEEYCPPFLYYN